MSRKLATIRRIREITPILNADNIELIKVDGWQVVSKKGEFKVNDLCVYFEIDSFLPIKPEFEFLRKSCYKRFENGVEGFRLKTMRLRGEVSQGLILPLSLFNIYYKKEGRDLTGKLNLLLFEPELLGQAHLTKAWIIRKLEFLWYKISCIINPKNKTKNKISYSNFPHYVPKTDEERIQNLTVSTFYGKNYEVSEKLDGCSCTMIYKDSEFSVYSRNVKQELQKDSSGIISGLFKGAFWKMVIKYSIVPKLTDLGKNIAIQGEIIGPNIQGNKYKLDDYAFYVFKIWFIDEKRYATPNERLELIYSLQLLSVPIIEDNMVIDDTFNTEKLIKMSEGKSRINRDTEREGLVFKCIDGSHSFKVINNKFLLKNGE